tara:strand:+ start:89 stop:406 length:318 start_codon:yes stop_codon:yes gene_type:complete
MNNNNVLPGDEAFLDAPLLNDAAAAAALRPQRAFADTGEHHNDVEADEDLRPPQREEAGNGGYEVLYENDNEDENNDPLVDENENENENVIFGVAQRQLADHWPE